MSDRRSFESAPLGDAADRDSRAEALLVEGLDKYFGGRYEEAIHVWTRVLFLDRAHARARAYIDRARTALGERQRRADEMLHAAEALVADGDLEQARTLVTQASETTADDERVARVWTDIERAERTRLPRAWRAAAPASVPVARARRVAAGTVTRLLAAAAVGALVVTVVLSPAVRGWFRAAAELPALPATSRGAAPQVLSREDVALLRARTLYARGRLAEALRALDRIGVPAGDRAAVDALRVEIQSLLLSTSPSFTETVTPRFGAGRP